MVETSGLLYTKNADGSMRVEYVDYGVGAFGGGDFESIYELDKQNADKPGAYIRALGYSDMKAGLKAVFSEKFSDNKFYAVCKEQGIEYEHYTWFD